MTSLSTELTGPFVLLDKQNCASVSRETLVHSHEIASVFGLGESKAALWYQKVAQAFIPPEDPSRVDRALQDVAAQLFSEETGRPVVREELELLSTQHTWLAARISHWYQAPEGEWLPLTVVVRPELSTWPDAEMEVDIGAPAMVGGPELSVRLVHEFALAVSGADRGAITVLCGPALERHRFGEFASDPNMQDLILDETALFLSRAAEGKPAPDPDDTTLLARTFHLLPHDESAPPMILTEEQCEWLVRLEEAKKRSKQAETEKTLYRNRIVSAMKEFSPSTTKAISPDGSKGCALHRMEYKAREATTVDQLRPFTSRTRRRRKW